MSEREGPEVTVERSCFDCKHCRSESYQCQGDSGFIVSCAHPALDLSQRIGDTTWNTPKWCPVAEPEHPHTAALRCLVEALEKLETEVGIPRPLNAWRPVRDARVAARALLGGAR